MKNFSAAWRCILMHGGEWNREGTKGAKEDAKKDEREGWRPRAHGVPPYCGGWCAVGTLMAHRAKGHWGVCWETRVKKIGFWRVLQFWRLRGCELAACRV